MATVNRITALTPEVFDNVVNSICIMTENNYINSLYSAMINMHESYDESVIDRVLLEVSYRLEHGTFEANLFRRENGESK